MREYVITTDSAADLPKEFLAERNIAYAPLTYMIDGETYPDMDGLTAKEFFNRIRAGSMPTTSQLTPAQMKDFLEIPLKEGKDILHIGFSSGLSGSCDSTLLAAEELRLAYPSAKIIVIDSLCASMGQGLLVYKAWKLKEEGKTMDEVANWVEENKLHVCHNVTVNDLNHLHRGGRVSKTTAVIGTMINIKPIIHVDEEGKLVVVGKERGRKKSIHKIVDMMASQSEGWDNDLVMVTHGDVPEEAEYVAQLIRKKCKVDQILIHNIGSVIGAHTGPGVLATFFMGNKR